MALIRWHQLEPQVGPSFPHRSLWREELDRLFNATLTAPANPARPSRPGWVPAVNLYQDQDRLVLQAELPGVKPEDIRLSLEGDVLTLSGERKETETPEPTTAGHTGRLCGRFERTLVLPLAVDANKVQATYQEGLLTVTLPRAEETKPKRIEVNVH